jgi:hypothetical protein
MRRRTGGLLRLESPPSSWAAVGGGDGKRASIVRRGSTVVARGSAPVTYEGSDAGTTKKAFINFTSSTF